MSLDEQTIALSKTLGERLEALKATVTTAESCTGGGIGYAITAAPGSSQWFERGFITYTNAAKSELLGISLDAINRHGAVSLETVEAMAVGAQKMAAADYAIAVSGVAGPGGGSAEKPVGTVCLAWACPGAVFSEKVVISGDRAQVRTATILQALQGLLARL